MGLISPTRRRLQMNWTQKWMTAVSSLLLLNGSDRCNQPLLCISQNYSAKFGAWVIMFQRQSVDRILRAIVLHSTTSLLPSWVVHALRHDRINNGSFCKELLLDSENTFALNVGLNTFGYFTRVIEFLEVIQRPAFI